MSAAAVTAQSTRDRDAGRQFPARDRGISIIEITLVLVLVLARLWEIWHWLPLVAPHERLTRALLSVAAAGVLAASLVRAPIALAQVGLSPKRWLDGWLSAATCFLISLLAIATIGYVWGRPWLHPLTRGWIAAYVGSAIVQQLCLQSFVNNRLFELSRGSDGQRARTAVVGSSLLFSLMHAPNPGLMLASGLAAGFWTWHFRRWLNLPCLVASHAALGITLRIFLGHGFLLNMRVGWGATRTLLGL